MNPILLMATALLIPSLSFADLSPLEFREEDGSPSTFPYQTRVPNGTLTDNGDGTISLVYVGAPSGGLFTAGSVPFGNGTASLAQDNANLFWDDALNRLGLGTAAPSSRLEVAGGDAYITGTGPDLRLIPTGGDQIHFGAEFAAATGTIGFISNATDGVRYAEFENTHVVNLGSPSVPFIRALTDGTGDLELRFPASSIGASEIERTQNYQWTGQHSNWGTSNFGETSTNERFGLEAMTKMANGIGNSFFGYQAGKVMTEGSFNSGFGGYSLLNMVDGLYNVGLGLQTLANNISGQLNLAIGFQNLYNSTGSGNISIASQGLFNLTTGGSNIGIGYLPGYGLTSGVALITGEGNILIGQSTDVTATNTSYGIALGWIARCASNQFSVGPLIHRMTLWGQTDSADRERGEIDVSWIDSTDGTRKARMTFSAYDTAEREGIRIDADGSRALVGLGNIPSAPTARVHVFSDALDVDSFRVESVATNDDPNYRIVQGRAATTDATVTTINTVAITSSNTYLLEARVIGRRTGGTSGTADDGSVHIRRAMITTKTGTVTINATQDALTQEDQAGWDTTLAVSGSNVLVRVTGAANNSITWHSTVILQNVGT